jgi:hypothetical protein
MKGKRAATIILALVVLVLAGCEQYATYTPSAADLTVIAQSLPEGPTKDAIQATAVARFMAAAEAESTLTAAQAAAQEAQAEAQRQRLALTSEAQAVKDRQNAIVQATRESVAVQATQQALALQATRDSMAVEATRAAEAQLAAQRATQEAAQATATAEARLATATAQAAMATQEAVQATRQSDAATATAVVVAQQDRATAVALQATRQSVELQAQRARWMHPLQFVGVILFVLVGAGALLYLAWRSWTLYEDRKRLVRRDPDEGEPILLLSRERLAMPLRQFGAYADMTQGSERAPLLAPTVEAQEGATMRQQTANAIQARQVEGVAKAKHGTQPDRNIVVLPKAAAREYSDPQLPPIHVRDAGDMKPLIEDVRRQLEAGNA